MNEQSWVGVWDRMTDGEAGDSVDMWWEEPTVCVRERAHAHFKSHR